MLTRSAADLRTAPVKNPGWLIPATLLAVASGVTSSLLLDGGHFFFGTIALTLSVVLLRWPISIWNANGATRLSPAWRWGLLAVVCALAVFFRFYQLNPPGLWGDDAINGLLAFDILDGKVRSPFSLVSHAHSYFHALTNYLIAGTFWLLGPGITGIRLPGVIANALCVPLLYATVAPLFGARTALVAAAFFATSPLQLGHSKGLAQIIVGQFSQMLGLCLLVRGVTGKRRDFVIASAVPFALCIYTYHSAKLAPLVAIPYVVAVLRRGDCDSRVLRKRARAAVGVFLVCLIPAIITYTKFPRGLGGRIGGTSIWPLVRDQGLAPLWDSIWRTLLIFHFEQGPIYHWFGLGFDPGLTAVVAFLAVHGLVTSFLRWREPRHLLLLAWAFIGLIPGFLSSEAPRAYRVLLASPPFYVWAALPVAQLLTVATRSRTVNRWACSLAILLVVSVPLVDFNDYFYHVYTHPLFRHFQGERMVELARALRRYGPGWTGRLLSDNFTANYESLRFLQRAWDVKIRDVDSIGEGLAADPGERGVVFLMTGGVFPAAALLQAWYPRQTLELIRLPEQRTWWLDSWWPSAHYGEPFAPIGAVFAVPREAIDQRRGLTVQFLAASGTVDFLPDGPLRRHSGQAWPRHQNTASPAGERRTLRRAQEERENSAHPVDDRSRRSTVGIETIVTASPQPRLDPASAAAMPPGVVRWSGLLAVRGGGTYGLRLRSNGRCRLRLDDREVVTDKLPEVMRPLLPGLHLLSIEAVVPAISALRFEWKPPHESWKEVPAESYFRLTKPGLLATFEARGVKARRFEPYPFYAFFPETFTSPFSSRWVGRLRVPPEGRTALRIRTNGEPHLLLDGKDLAPDAKLSGGEHHFLLQVRKVPTHARLLLEWQEPDGTIEPIPPDAFIPPDSAG